MQKLCIAFAALVLSAFAEGQTTIKPKDVKDLRENIDPVWKENDPAFNANKAPAKWEDQSGVIIAQKKTLVFDRPGHSGGLKVYETTHNKVWLHDKDAVKSYSELYFSVCKDFNGFAARIIKPDGKKEDIDLAAAVAVDKSADIPDLFRAYIESESTAPDRTFASYNQFYKLAVPNLQPGDVIEYASYVYQPFILKEVSYYEMEPVYFLLSKEMPIMYQKLEIKTGNRSYVNLKSLNGAPAIKETNDDKWNVYQLEDRDREKVKDQSWINEFMALPLLKFQIIYADGFTPGLFIDKKKDVQNTIAPEELAKKARWIYRPMRDELSYNVPTFFQFHLYSRIQFGLKKAGGKSLSEDEYIRKAYYLLRHEMGFENTISSRFFACALIENLKERNIQADLILTAPNNVTTMTDLLFKDELIWLVRVKDKYIYSFNHYSNVYDINPACQGNEAYVIGKSEKIPTVKVTLPMSTWTDNKGEYQMEASLDNSLANLSVQVTNAFAGISKLSVEGPALAYTSAFRDDYKTYNGVDPVTEIDKRKDREEEERKIAAEKEESVKKKPELMKKQLEGDFKNIVSYDEFKLISDGRSFDNQVLKYSEKYVLGDLVKKAGKNLLVSIPALVGSQVQIKDDQRERRYDINVRYGRTNQWKIVFHIPDGYSLEDVSDLNISVDNETGTFTSTAKVENKMLLLNVKKTYKNRDVKKEDWSKMTAFLDAAWNFSQKKIVLKKN